MLGSSFAWGLAFTNIGMPSILGYMLSGVIIGPYFMNVIGDGHHNIESIRELGDLGLTILMFVTGMHLDINTYTRNKSELLKPLKFTGLQVICSLVLVVGIELLPNWIVVLIMQSHPIKSILGILFLTLIYLKKQIFFERFFRRFKRYILIFILFGGSFILYAIKNHQMSGFSVELIKVIICAIAILSLNSTAISLKLLEIRDKKNSNIGQKITEILVAQDLILIGFLILLRILANGVSIVSIAIKISSAAGLLILVDLLAKTNPNPLSKLIDYIAINSKELQILFISSFGLFFASICEYIGLSEIYGAFIAGVILGNLHEHGDYIEKKCQSIRDIFVTLFFVYVGTLMNLKKIMFNLPKVLLINLIIITFKYFSNYYIYRAVERHDRQMTKNCMILSSLLLTQVSEFSMQLIAIAGTGISQTSTLGQTLDLFFQSCIFSLTFGCLATVLIKRFLYYRGTIN